MDPNVFRKGDSKSILVIDRNWNEVINKPFRFDEMTDRLLAIMKNADPSMKNDEGEPGVGILTKEDTLRKLKTAINRVLIGPLTDDRYGHSTNERPQPHEGCIYVDAFWDEIPDIPLELSEALTRLSLMNTRVVENYDNTLNDKSTLMDTKNIMNETVLKPMNGINEEE